MERSEAEKIESKKIATEKIIMVRTGIVKCKRCGKWFKEYMHNPELCPACMTLDAYDFDKVRQYLYAHDTATAIELSENTGVAVSQIEWYLRNGRLEIPENSPIFIRCERCGTDIRYGRFCSDCSVSLSNALRIELNFDESQVGEKPKKKDKQKNYQINEERMVCKVNYY
jgi:ribosomal protein L37E